MLNSKQQTQLLSLWLADEQLFVKTATILKSEYFVPELRKIVSFVGEYHQKYNGIPTIDIINAEVNPSVELRRVKKLTSDQRKYAEEQFEVFCRQSALRNIIVDHSPEMIQSENYGALEKMIRDAISIKLDTEIGIQFFNDIERRHAQPESNTIRYSTGYPVVDAEMDGGVARKEMLLALAISGGGKSVLVLNMALNLARQRDLVTHKYLNVVYISLELSEKMIDQRTQMIVAGMSSRDVQSKHVEVQSFVNAVAGDSGELIIRKLRLGSTVNDIRALLKEIEIQVGWTPDVIVLDYLDKLHPAQKVSTENIGTRDKFITEEFYDLLDEYDAIGLTASQLVKDATKVEVYNQSHQAGGAEKTRSADWVLAIILSDSMRAAGQLGIQFLKTRSSDGVGQVVMLGWNAKSLRITNTGKSPGAQPSSGVPTTQIPNVQQLIDML